MKRVTVQTTTGQNYEVRMLEADAAALASSLVAGTNPAWQEFDLAFSPGTVVLNMAAALGVRIEEEEEAP